MIYKIYEGLSDYLIAPDGTAIHKSTGEAIPFQRTPLVAGYTAKLITDETFTFLKGKRKPIKLVRRFTREQLVKMYGQSKNMFNDLGSEVPYTEKYKLDQDPTEWKERTKPAEPGIVRSMNVVGDVMPEPLVYDPVAKQIAGEFIEEAGQISQHQLDQLSASKRVVKANPKTKKSEVKKVTKAIKQAMPKLSEMKVPYFRIEGVHYQSARSASKALGVAVNTVLKRAKANKDGWFYIETE